MCVLVYCKSYVSFISFIKYKKVVLFIVILFFYLSILFSWPAILDIIVKILDWGEDGIATAAETAALRASFQQEVAVWHKLDHPNIPKVKVISADCHIGCMRLNTISFSFRYKNVMQFVDILSSPCCPISFNFLEYVMCFTRFT